MYYKIYDISQELINSNIYPGDPRPKLETIKDINNDLYNLSLLHMCVHNGTHIDAPLHFIKDGNDVNQIDVNKFIGLCYVVSFNGIMSEDDAEKIIKKIKITNIEASRKLLLKGNTIVSSAAAKVFVKHNLDLVGTELLSVGDINAPMEVHKILLTKQIVLLEGIRLSNVHDGVYFLNCAPLAIANADGSPCRAILIKFYEK